MGRLLLQQMQRELHAPFQWRMIRAQELWSTSGTAGMHSLAVGWRRCGRSGAPDLAIPRSVRAELHDNLILLRDLRVAVAPTGQRFSTTSALPSGEGHAVALVGCGSNSGAEKNQRSYTSSSASDDTRAWFGDKGTASAESSDVAAALRLSEAQALVEHWRITSRFNPGLPRESIWQWICRWADVTGFFSRWNNRKYWGCTAPGPLRLDAPMMTEYERKVLLFREANVQIFLLITLLILLLPYYYRNARQPLPQVVGFDTPLRSTMGTFSSLPLMYPKRRCPHCRIYDPTCKKACFEKLRAAGHKMFLDDTRFRAWSTPRVNLLPPANLQ